MRWIKDILTFVFVLAVIFILIMYWFFPFKSTEFSLRPMNYNFSLSGTGLSSIQFYKNMRFPSSNISYKLYNCPLAKGNEMESAFEIMEENTILKFHKKDLNEEISVTCDSHNKIKEGMFIGGEGGPTNITKTNNFNVILHGNILLLRETQCQRPNIPLHELLHALGFDHSTNPNNIMYEVVKCQQTIGAHIPEVIDRLYSYPTLPDLAFDNISAGMDGRFLDINMTIRNHGLKEVGDSNVLIYSDEKLVRDFELEGMELGMGRTMKLTNIWISKINFDNLIILINSTYEELDKENNKIILEIKK